MSLLDEEKDANARYPWVGWACLIVGLAMLTGGLIRACL